MIFALSLKPHTSLFSLFFIIFIRITEYDVNIHYIFHDLREINAVYSFYA